jgi:hypothetical protein
MTNTGTGTSTAGPTPTPEDSIMTTLATLRDAALTAIGLGDWATAYNKLVQVDVIISTTPNSGQNGAIMDWRSEQIEPLLLRVEKEKNKAAAGGGGIQRTRIGYVSINP